MQVSRNDIFYTTWVTAGTGLLSLLIALGSSSQGFAQNAPSILRPSVVTPDVDAPITPERERSLKIFKALTGVSVPIDDPRLKSMEQLILADNVRQATQIPTQDPLFYDVRVRDLARQMSTLDESVRAPLSDFVATFVGVVRDSDTTSAKELLTGNFTYQADPDRTMINGEQQVRSDLTADIMRSNNHYIDIQLNNFSLHAVLRRVDGQMVMPRGTGADGDTPVAHPDAAGLLTTRAWMSAHATAGTNRRLVEYSFRQFMCTPITEWADASSPDDRIGRDVERTPGGDASKFLVTCKSCHANMDALRGAFARVDFDNGPTYRIDNSVEGKLNRNGNEFPQGFVTRDDSFLNYATVGKNADQFGWRDGMTGAGLNGFGRMLASSQGFSRCLVKKVFAAVCSRDPFASEEALVRQLAEQFETDNYHMRRLFESVALRPECIK